jgi:hypothetical protein
MSTTRKAVIAFIAVVGLVLGSADSEGRDRRWRRSNGYNNWNYRGNYYRGSYPYRSYGNRYNGYRGNYYYSRPNYYYYPNYSYPNYYNNGWRGGIYFGF